jgi:hypothetical protein
LLMMLLLPFALVLLHITNSKMLIPPSTRWFFSWCGAQGGKDLASLTFIIHLQPRPFPSSLNQQRDGTGLNVHWHVTCSVPSVCLCVCLSATCLKETKQNSSNCFL